MSGDIWVVSYVALWVAVIALSLAVLALLRQVGVLHARLRPIGVHPAGEGLEVGDTAPPLPGHDYSSTGLTLLAFTSPTCTICSGLLPGFHAMSAQYDDVEVKVIDHSNSTSAIFLAFNVFSTPYLTAVSNDGIIRGRGVANTIEQAEILVAAARQDTGALGAL